MSSKKHFKLYKSGKQWCVAAIVIFAATLGLASVNNASAATIDTNTVVQQAQMTGQTNNSSTVKGNIERNITDSSTNKDQTTDKFENTVTNVDRSQGQTDGKQGAEKTTDQPNENKAPQATNWTKNTNNQWVYSGKDSQDIKGTQYVQLPTIPNTNVKGDTNWYFVKDGVAQSGVQQWAGSYYYFDPITYLRVDNDYRQAQWGDWYMFGPDGRIVTGLYDYKGNTYYANPSTFLREKNTYIQTEKDGRGVLLGADGVALSGIQYWNNAYYYFDPATHLQANKRNYVQSQWGDWYLIGDSGQVLSGVQQWAGAYYYFDPITYLRVDNDYRQAQWGDWYMFGNDGRIVTGLYDYNGNTYYANPVTYLREKNTYVSDERLLLGDDGAALSGIQLWNGAFYYFDPVTHILANKRNYVQSQWGDWYLIDNNGKVLSGLQEWYGSYYYFDPTTFLKVTNEWHNNQYFGADGTRYQNQFLNDRGRLYRFDANGNMLKNRWFNDDNAKKSYYFGSDGVAYTDRHVINGVTYIFNSDGVRVETIK